MNQYYVFGSRFGLSATRQAQYLAFLQVAGCIAIFILGLLNRMNKNTTYDRYFRYTEILIAICLGSLLTGTPLRRFVSLAFYALVPVLMQVLQKQLTPIQKSGVVANKPLLLLNSLLLICLFCTIVVSVYTNLIGYQDYYVSTIQHVIVK